MFQTIPIKISQSDNPEDYCFKPMLITDDDRVMLIWGQYEKNTDTFTLRMVHFSRMTTYSTAPYPILVGTAVSMNGGYTGASGYTDYNSRSQHESVIGYNSHPQHEGYTDYNSRSRHGCGFGYNSHSFKDKYFIDKAKEIIICELAKTDELLFVENVGIGLYSYWLETATGYKCVVINGEGKIIGEDLFENNKLPVKSITNLKPVHVEDSTVDPHVKYNYDKKQYIIYNNGVEQTIDNVFSIPLTIKVQSGLVISWLSCTDQLNVQYYNAISNTLFNLPTEPFAVEYLIGAPVDNNLIVIGGYSKSKEVLKLNYYRQNETGLKLVDTQFWRSTDYKGKYFDIAPLNKGFMLISEGPRDPVMVQRFTHLGTWLYPLKAIDDMPSYSPTMKGNYITYLKDGQVWLRKMYIDNIPEIATLEL